MLTIFAFGFNPTFDFSDSGTSGDAESAVALERFEKGQPSGAADPTSVLLRSTDGSALDEAELDAYAGALGEADGVAQVLPGRPERGRLRRGVQPGPRGRPGVGCRP